MENLNNLYNFKNPIRHFFNPVKFNIFKTENSQRILSFPNILNFYILLKKLKAVPNFNDIPNMSCKKRVAPDLDLGEFAILSYSETMQRDFFNLTK